MQRMAKPMEVIDLKTARQAIVNTSACQSQRWREQQTRAVRTGVHPDILLFEKKFISKAKSMGIPLFCHAALRGDAEQTRLRNAGFSNAGAGQSPHQYGLAVDIIHGVLGWNLHRKSWDILHHIGLEVAVANSIPIKWGGHFNSIYDPAHWEHAEWPYLKGDYPHEPFKKIGRECS